MSSKLSRARSRRLRRAAIPLVAALFAAAILAASAFALTDTIANHETVQPGGKFGPYRNTLTLVYVHSLDGRDDCEDAYNASGGWAQEKAWCSTSSTYHEFCGCQERAGWVGPDEAASDMDGHQDYATN